MPSVAKQARLSLLGCVVGLGIWLLGAALAAPSAIRLRSTPLSAFAGTVFKFEIRLAPDASDRWIALAFEPPFVGDGAWTIDGANALPIYQMTRRIMEPGTYHVAAIVGHGEVARAVSTVTLLVVGN